MGQCWGGLVNRISRYGPINHHILPKNQACTGQILGWGGGGQEQKCEMQGRAGQGGVKQHRNGNFVRLKITQFCFGNCVPDYENKPNTRLFFLLLQLNDVLG